MNKIQLMGIGNALVDIEYRVTEDELAAFGVDKGSMTLTDPARQHEMITALGDRDAHRSSGGSVANSIIAYAQFGGSAAFSSLLGKDTFGDFYASEFNELGIHLSADSLNGDTTGTCLVLITPDSERTLNTTLAVNTNFSREHINEDVIKNSEWLFIFEDAIGAAIAIENVNSVCSRVVGDVGRIDVALGRNGRHLVVCDANRASLRVNIDLQQAIRGGVSS